MDNNYFVESVKEKSSVMVFIGIVFIACTLLWILIASAQASRTVGLKLKVPEWLAHIAGSKTNLIDPGLFSLQVLCVLAFLWSIPSGLFHGTRLPGDIFRIGLLISVGIVAILFFFLVYFAKRQN